MLNKILFKLFGVRLISSQTGEDLILETLMPEQKTGLYIDIGANHPIKFNNTFLFHNKGWSGINIEPNPERLWWFKIFRRKDINLNIGIGPEKSEMDFYVFNTHTLSTFDKKSKEEYEKMGHKLKKVIKVPILPLSEVLKENVGEKQIDIMSVDTEGFDMQVLQSNDWNKFKPRFIILETLEYRSGTTGKKLNEKYDPYMKEIGYHIVAETHINTIYEKNN